MPHRTKFVPLLRLQFFTNFLKDSKSKMIPAPVKICPMPAIPEIEALAAAERLAEKGISADYMLEKIRASTRFRDCFRAACSCMLAFVRGRRYYVTVGGKRAPVIGHVGVSHTTVDVTDIECGPGTEVLLDAAPLYVPASIPRQYVE